MTNGIMKKCKNENCQNPKATGRSQCFSCYGKARRRDETIVKPKSPEGHMKILMVDVETTPNKVYTWGLFNQNIGINQIIEPGGLLCFAAKWYGSDEVMFYSTWQDGPLNMVLRAWELLDKADILMHWNGISFDRKHFNREFLLQGFPPPTKSRDVDLLLTVRKQFRFVSNKLQNVAVELGLPGKVEHEGFPLWVKCMEGEKDALERMEEYNRQDVVLLEEIHEILLPWIPNYPHRHLYEPNQEQGCPTCGASINYMTEAGFAYTQLSRFQQFRCLICNSYFRSSRRDTGVSLQGVVL